MGKFVELETSLFDPAFTLEPFPFIEPLYAMPYVQGFSSEGMNFVIRADTARQILFDKRFERGLYHDPEVAEREMLYAERYPWRAKQFQHSYNNGQTNLQLKTLLVRTIHKVAETASFDAIEPLFTRLGDGGRVDDYIERISTLPLRIFLLTAGIPFDEEDLTHLFWNGYRFLNALENAQDESLIAGANQAVKEVWEFVEQRYSDFDPNSIIGEYVANGKSAGFSDDELIANMDAFLLISLANTLGISSGYLLRNTIRYPEVTAQLKVRPDLIQRDDTIIEFLRRDNHVKSLSRFATETIQLDALTIDQNSNINLFFPGINLDPGQWQNPLAIDLQRQFTPQDNLVFGGSIFMCIGKALGLVFMKHMLAGFVRYLPEQAEIIEDEIEMDGSWVAERIISKMPIQLS